MKKIIEKLEANFKLMSLGLLTFIALVATGTGYSVWSNSTGTVYPGPSVNWPKEADGAVQKGYIGDPTDVLVNQDANLVGNESIYNMLGKTWYQKANNDSGICGACRENNSALAYSTGCCKTAGSRTKVCAADDGYVMSQFFYGNYGVDNQNIKSFFCFKAE